VKLLGQESANVVHLQFDRLSARWSPQHVKLIELNLQDLCSACERKPLFMQVLDQCAAMTTFGQWWGYVLDWFEHLKTLCGGGLATAFPRTSTVESDFSEVKWEKDN
jgi:hypothetical protein